MNEDRRVASLKSNLPSIPAALGARMEQKITSGTVLSSNSTMADLFLFRLRKTGN